MSGGSDSGEFVYSGFTAFQDPLCVVDWYFDYIYSTGSGIWRIGRMPDWDIFDICDGSDESFGIYYYIYNITAD